MAENHELRLTIDAASAKRGSRDFVAAVEAVKKAVRDLEKDSTGAFTKLKKSLSDVSKQGKVKIDLVDKSSKDRLDRFTTQTKALTTGVNALIKASSKGKTAISGLATAYSNAQRASSAFRDTTNSTNRALQRQIELAGRAKTAMSGLAAPSKAVRPVQASAGGKAVTAPSTVSPERIEKALASARAESERLTTSLMKVGGFKSLRILDGELNRLKNSLSSGEVSTKQFAAATLAFSTATTKARTSLSTMNAKAADAARVEKELASAQNAAAKAAQTHADLQARAGRSFRESEVQVLRLIERLKKLGDTTGAARMEAALNNLRAKMAGGVASANGLKAAMDGFHKSMSSGNRALISAAAAHDKAAASARKLAAEERLVASNARAVEREMRSIAAASNATSAAFQKATGNLRGLENAFNATFQAGSMFRQLMGSLTLGTFTVGMFAAGDALDQFLVTMETAKGSVASANNELRYVDDLTSRLGVNVLSARDNYSKFAVSADIAGVSADQTRKIFESVSTAMSVLGRSTEDQNLAFMALEQMMSKGKVSSEELRRQLGERLPGAVNLMAKALGVTTDGLQDMLKAGEINSADALPKFADEVMKRFGPGLQSATKRAGFNLGTLKNEIIELNETAAHSGFMQTLAVEFKELTHQLRSTDAQDFAKTLGEGFALGAELASDGLQFLIENIDKLGMAMKGIAAGILVRQIGYMGQALATSSQQVLAFIANWKTGTAGLTAAEAMTQRHTQALLLNTEAMVANAAATKAGGAATAAQVKNLQGLQAAANSTTGAVGRMAGAAALASRALGIIAPIAGLAVGAMMILPGLFGETGDESNNMADDLSAALRRSGVAFEELAETASESMDKIKLRMNLQDLGSLSVGKGTGSGLAALKQLDTNVIGGDQRSWSAKVLKRNDDALESTGIDESVWRDMNSASRDGARQLVEAAKAVEKREMTYIELRDLARSLAKANYASAPVFKALEDSFADETHRERAQIEQRASLISTQGSGSDNAQMAAARAGASVLDGGSTRSRYEEDIQGMVDAGTLGLAQAQDMKRQLDMMLADGVSGDRYMQLMTELLSPAALRIEEAARQVAANREKLLEAREELSRASSYMMNANSNFRPNGIDQEQLSPLAQDVTGGSSESNAVLASLDEMAQKSVTATLNFEYLKNAMSDVAVDGTKAGRAFNDIVAQMSALPPHQQTFQTLSRLIDELSGNAVNSDGSLDGMLETLRKTARANSDAGVTVEELTAVIKELGLAENVQAQAMIEALKAARGYEHGLRVAEVSADNATAAVYDNADAMASAGAAAETNARRLMAFKSALDAITGVRSTMRTAVSEGIAEIERLTEAASLRGRERTLWEEGEKGGMIGDILIPIDKEIAAMTEKLNEAASSGASMRELQNIQRNVELLQKERERAEKGLTTAVNTYLDAEEKRAADEAAARKAERGTSDSSRRAAANREEKARREALGEEGRALEDLSEDMDNRIRELKYEQEALRMVAKGQAYNVEIAELLALAMKDEDAARRASNVAKIRQLEIEQRINDQLEKQQDYKNPFTEILKDTGTTIADSMKSPLAQWFEDGTYEKDEFFNSLRASLASLAADKTVDMIKGAFSFEEGAGSIWNGIKHIANRGKAELSVEAGVTADSQAAVTTGNILLNAHQQGALTIEQSILRAFAQAGMTVQQNVTTGAAVGGAQLQMSVASGAQQGGASMQQQVAAGSQQGAGSLAAGVVQGSSQGAAILATGTAAGGAGAAIPGADQTAAAASAGFFSMGNPMLQAAGSFGMSLVAGAFSEGGHVGSPVTRMAMPASAFANAPHYAEGTANTSGIPAVLHDNEAVVPLSRGRKIPVDMSGAGGGGSMSLNVGDIKVSVESRGDEESDAEMAARVGNALHQSLNDLIESKMAEQMAYGGIMNPRGG